METDFKDDVFIDPNALDVEWLRQPTLMLKYAQEEAEAAKREDVERERLDAVKAELDKEIRSNPDKFDISKTTESAILSAILLHPSYKEVSEKYIQAKYESKMAKAATRAIEMKKDALENLVKLYGQQYFAGPKAPRDIDKEWERKVREREINKKMKFERK